MRRNTVTTEELLEAADVPEGSEVHNIEVSDGGVEVEYKPPQYLSVAIDSDGERVWAIPYDSKEVAKENVRASNPENVPGIDHFEVRKK